MFEHHIKQRPLLGLNGLGGGAGGNVLSGELASVTLVDYLYVAGGGGYFNGGAGGYLSGTDLSGLTVTPGVEYTVQIGLSGAPTNNPGQPSKVYRTDSPTSILGSEVTGGGAGNSTDGGTGASGGSGGGNFGYPTCGPFAAISPPACTGGSGIPGQGYPGGDGFRGPNTNGYYPRNGGGGGGAGGRGQQGGPGYNGAGGPGVYNDITGTSVYYAAGGPSPTPSIGGVGSPGAVIFRYPNQFKKAEITGTVTESSYSSYRVYNFTGPGTITF
jgi:hypothetical protein